MIKILIIDGFSIVKNLRSMKVRTSVTVMKASLDMLEREGIHSKYLDYAAEENEKMRKLVIELLDYSKMEYQEEKSFRESVNFSQCIEGISLEFEAMAFEKEVKIARTIGCTEFLCSAGSQFC